MRAIFFDLDGTLLHFNKDYDKIIEDVFIDELGNCKYSWIDRYSERFFKNFESFETNPYKKAFDHLDLGYDPERMTERLWEEELEMYEVADGAKEYLDLLSEETSLGILTNGVSEWQRGKIRHFGLLDYFDTVVVSYDIGFHKPQREIYDFAEKGVPEEKYLMVGDSREDDIQGAENAGWNARLYEGDGFDSLSI